MLTDWSVAICAWCKWECPEEVQLIIKEHEDVAFRIIEPLVPGSTSR